MTYFTKGLDNNIEVPKREQTILDFWNKHNIFQKSVKQTAKGPAFVFYEGPPTANGKPGIHHILSRVYKDVYIRFYVQQGYHVPRKAGWDCHGLPVEREVEKALGVKTKAEIEQRYGIAHFNKKCKESVFRYISEWNSFSERMAFFVDLERPYFTMDNEYIESVWSLLKIIWDKKLIYQGYKVVPWDPILGTTMSAAEVDLGYREVSDPSLTVLLALEDAPHFGSHTYLLVWTTTPWTLPANTALAIAPKQEYVLIQCNTNHYKQHQESLQELLHTASQQGVQPDQLKFICAKERLAEVFGESYTENCRILDSFLGDRLLGLKYKRLFSFLPLGPEEQGKQGWYILGADFVTTDSGTGIVHIAPAYGADDLSIGKRHHLPLLHSVGLDGNFLPNTPYEGEFFKKADKNIIRDLKKRGLVWKSERYKHKYPFGYRTDAPLLYYAKHAWYIRTTEKKPQLLKNNQTISWFPKHIQNGRFGNWLENNLDWALSRERYWGTPLPIWTDGKGKFRLIASRGELSTVCGRDLSQLDLHRPNVDEITFVDDETGHTMRRVPEVIDCWFDSGAMPYTQWAISAEEADEVIEKESQQGQQKWKDYFPADFISEAVDQTRGWFYTLLAISTMVSDKSSYKNVVCLGHVLDENGEKMSKSKGNIVDPWAVFQIHGADAIRWYFLTGAPPGNSRKVGQPGSTNDPVTHVRGFLNMLQNSVNFFILYAGIDNIPLSENWEHSPISQAPEFAKRSDMDRWLLSTLQNLIDKVTTSLTNYDCQQAGKEIELFLDSMSNWYIRRNRRRFWKGNLDADKFSAYDTLHRCLVTVSRLVAPFTPFMAEQAFQALVVEPLKKSKAKIKEIPESVFLAGWPKADFDTAYNQKMVKEGEIIKECVFLGRAARMQAGLKIRQPLARMLVFLEKAEDREIIQNNQSILLEELNVKELSFLSDSAEILTHRIKPNLPRLGKRLGAQVRIVQQFLQKTEAKQILQQLKVNNSLTIPKTGYGTDKVNEKDIELTTEDLLIEHISKEGTSGAEGKNILVALETKLSPKLITEGVARDLVRNIQQMRKDKGLAVTDRIGLMFLQADKNIAQALIDFKHYIEEETLAKIDSQAPEKPTTHNKVSKKIKIEQEQVEAILWKLT